MEYCATNGSPETALFALARRCFEAAVQVASIAGRFSVRSCSWLGSSSLCISLCPFGLNIADGARMQDGRLVGNSTLVSYYY
jgi:hypothetical protein